jgi:hypothetical protein
MWFKVLSFILAAMSFVKLGFGLAMGDRFYDWARKEYGRNKPSSLITTLFVLTFLLVVVTWYATFAHYVPYGWILTALFTLIAVYLVVILACWKSIAPRLVRMIAKFEKKRGLWYAIGAIWGVIFLLMGIFVY